MNNHQEKPWLPYRNDIIDFLNLGKDRNYAHANFEIDITKMAMLISERKYRIHTTLCHLAYLLWCYGQAIKQHPEMQAMKKGKKIILFEDVDISMIFEKETEDGRKVPVPYIFRSIQNKNFDEILQELVGVESKSLDDLIRRKKSNFFRSLPQWLRLAILKKALSDPFKWKEALGTVAFTTLGMTIRNRKFWPIPIGPYVCMMAAGSSYSIKDIHGQNKTYWCLCFNFDHNMSDGAPAIRFGRTFMNLIESASGL